jgi:hypothetical protein
LVFALIICDTVIYQNAPLSCPSSFNLLKLVFYIEPLRETGYSGSFIKSIRVSVIIAGIGPGREGETARRAAVKALGDTTRILVSSNWLLLQL